MAYNELKAWSRKNLWQEHQYIGGGEQYENPHQYRQGAKYFGWWVSSADKKTHKKLLSRKFYFLYQTSNGKQAMPEFFISFWFLSSIWFLHLISQSKTAVGNSEMWIE